jgi:sec-independent protein translocase protein TatC
MSTNNRNTDPEDMFSDTRMSFGDHLEELRLHLWRAVAGFGVAMVFSFFIGWPVLQYIAQPVEDQLGKFYDQRVHEVLDSIRDGSRPEMPPTPFLQFRFVRQDLMDALDPKKSAKEVSDRPRPVIPSENTDAEKSGLSLGPLGGMLGITEGVGSRVKEKNTRDITQDDTIVLWTSIVEPLRTTAALEAAERVVGRRPTLSTLSVQEGIVVFFKVCIGIGLVLGSPWILWQIWAFIAAGLYPQEKKLIYIYLPISLGLFLFGVAMCEVLVMHRVVETLLWFNKWIGLEPDLRLSEWLGFAIWMPIAFGASFQTPLLMLALDRVGILSVDTYRKYRKVCWFAMLIIAAILLPPVDPITLMLLGIPMCLLFELGIWLCTLRPKQDDLDIDVPESGEQIEV